VHSGACVSGMSIIDRHFGFLKRLFSCLTFQIIFCLYLDVLVDLEITNEYGVLPLFLGFRKYDRVVGFHARFMSCQNLTVLLVQPWYKWFVAWSHSISHLGRWLLHGSLEVINLQPSFKVCNIPYLRVLFHSY
jgi:hypothetical protein